jgi:hypothetical protein
MHHKFALIPRPLLPEREKGSRIGSPSPVLGEGFRVRANAFTTVAGLIRGNYKGGNRQPEPSNL